MTARRPPRTRVERTPECLPLSRLSGPHRPAEADIAEAAVGPDTAPSTAVPPSP